MANTAEEMQDAQTNPGTAKSRPNVQRVTSKWKPSAVLSSPYVLGGAALGITAAGYALVRRKKAAPYKVSSKQMASKQMAAKQMAPKQMASKPGKGPAPERSEDFGDILKAVGVLASLAASFASATNNTKVDAHAIKKDIPVVPTRPEVHPSDVKDAQPGKTPPVRPKFEHTSASWLGRQWQICVAAANAWIDDYAPSMGAALSYYMLFSLAPLLVMVIAIAGAIFGQDAAQGAIITQLGGIMGQEGAAAVQGLLEAAREPSTGIVASIVGGFLLLLGATAMFAELQTDLDRIWEVPAKDKPSGLWGWLRSRVLSFGLVLGFAFMLMISLVVSAALAATGEWMGGNSGAESVIANVLNFAASLVIFTVLFAMIYKIMPSAKISWHDVWMGSAVTAVLFNVGKSLIGLYLAKSDVASGFGAAGSVVILVAWFYYSAQIFLFGAEYTWVYANSKVRNKD